MANIDQTPLLIEGGIYRSETITAAGADTFAKGTILARDTSTLKFVLFVKGGSTNGNGIPGAVLMEDLVYSGAGDKTSNIAIAGTFNQSKLIIDADGDASNIDGAVVDGLRAKGLNPVVSTDLVGYDN